MLVVDPVLASSGGRAFTDDAGARAIVRYLFPRATLVTPNLDEAELLTGVCVHSEEGLREAAALLLDMGPRAALVKGGHTDGVVVPDWLFTKKGLQTFESPRIKGGAHGTGCALSAVIATRLALGDPVARAVAAARARVRDALKTRHAPSRRAGGRYWLGI